MLTLLGCFGFVGRVEPLWAKTHQNACLSDGEDEAFVSLQQTFAALSDRAGDDDSLNHAADVIPSLSVEDREWVQQRLASAESARERE